MGRKQRLMESLPLRALGQKVSGPRRIWRRLENGKEKKPLVLGERKKFRRRKNWIGKRIKEEME